MVNKPFFFGHLVAVGVDADVGHGSKYTVFVRILGHPLTEVFEFVQKTGDVIGAQRGLDFDHYAHITIYGNDVEDVLSFTPEFAFGAIHVSTLVGVLWGLSHRL